MRYDIFSVHDLARPPSCGHVRATAASRIAPGSVSTLQPPNRLESWACSMIIITIIMQLLTGRDRRCLPRGICTPPGPARMWPPGRHSRLVRQQDYRPPHCYFISTDISHRDDSPPSSFIHPSLTFFSCLKAVAVCSWPFAMSPSFPTSQ